MPRLIAPALAVALLATACQVVVAPPGEPAKRPAATAPAAASPSPAAAAKKPSAAPAVAPAGPTALAKLVRPAGATTPLGGRVRLDASTMVAAGAGNVLSHNGAQIVAAGGLNLISEDGSTLVGMDGGSIVAAGAGNAIAAVGPDGAKALAAAGSGLISEDGSTLIGADGGSLVAAGGGNVLSPNGGQVLSPNGAAIVGNNGGRAIAPYGLLAAPYGVMMTSAPAANVTRKALPAAGMMVWVRSLIDGQPVPLGQDAKGATVWAVYTDADGEFELYLPEGLAENVVIEAEKPFARGALAVRRLTDPNGVREVDEATTAVARSLRETMSAKFTRMLARADQMAAGGMSDEAIIDAFFDKSKAPQAAVDAMASLIKDILREVQAAGIPQADHPRLALALGDRVLATGGSLEGVAIEPSHFGVEYETANLMKDPYFGQEALPALESIFRATIAHHEGRSPEELEARYRDEAYLKLANAFAARAGRPPYAIRSGADFVAFIQREYLPLIQGDGYGCTMPDCQPYEEGCLFVETGLACFPERGAGPLSSAQIRALTETVFVDAGLPGSHAYMINAASIALGTKFGLIAALRPEELTCTIRTFKAGGGRCETP